MSFDALEEIAKLEAEANEAQQRFVKLMGGLATGETTVDEACAAFRESGNLQLDIMEARIRAIGAAIQMTGIQGLADSFDFTLPTIG